jgi:hypothetical protein
VLVDVLHCMLRRRVWVVVPLWCWPRSSPAPLTDDCWYIVTYNTQPISTVMLNKLQA